MKVYRLKHLPTGLYYTPVRYVRAERAGKQGYEKSNLSTTGKLYSTKPSLKWFANIVRDHTSISVNSTTYSSELLPLQRRMVPEEWEIEEVSPQRENS